MRSVFVAAILALAISNEPLHAQKAAPIRIPKSVLKTFEGEYIHPDGSSVMVRLNGETLFREIPGQRMALVPMSDTLFRLGSVFTVQFIIDKAGGVTMLGTDGVAAEIRLRRKGSPPEAPRPLPVAQVNVPRSMLERYVGVYEYLAGQMSRTDLRVVIRLRGDSLFRYSFGEELLTPISETLFKVGRTSLVVEFVVDEMGVTQVMGLGGQQMLSRLPAKR